MTPSPAQFSENESATSNAEVAKPTLATFSPSHTGASPATKQRSTILVHRKSPLLVATPPAVTRALAFSHPFLLSLTKIVGLLTWTSGEPWESFFVVASFWAITIYGDIAIRCAGPIIALVALISAMFSRSYSPLSSTGGTGEKDSKKNRSGSSMKHQKSLDEIVETLNTFTSRCDVLLEPFLQLTDFLSTQRTATPATTRPAFTSLFIRILIISPLWVALANPPLKILTTKWVILAVGTTVLSWHSRPARACRTFLWRYTFTRRLVSLVTGLNVAQVQPKQTARSGQLSPPPLPPRSTSQQDVAKSLITKDAARSPGVRFTFVVFENQRRWLGVGWTHTLLAYERAPWTDEHLNVSDSIYEFQLPAVENGTAFWRWVPGSEWQVEGGGKGKASSGTDGWIYYDNKWNDGRRGQDGWGRYTRRRKWYRDAELVEADFQPPMDSSTYTIRAPQESEAASGTSTPGYKDNSGDPSSSQTRRRGFLRRRRNSWNSAQSSSDFSGSTTLRSDEDDSAMPPQHERSEDWDVGDDVKMGLG